MGREIRKVKGSLYSKYKYFEMKTVKILKQISSVLQSWQIF